MFRKISAIFLCFVLALSTCACSREDTDDGKLNIVATNFALYDFARQIVGDCAHVKMLMDPGVESHSYDPTPADIVSIYSCDVFLYTGGESDEWLNNILGSISSENTSVLALMDCVELLQEEEFEQNHDHEEEEENEYDEHIWTSPLNAIEMVKAIADTIIARDSTNAEIYEKNRDSYIESLTQLDRDIQDVVDGAERKTLVFGDRMPMLYFLRRYGLDCYAAFPGCAAETEPSAATLSGLISAVSDENIPVVLTIELSNGQIADIICEETGAKKMQINTCHNISRDEFLAGATYLSQMYKNIDVLKEALN